MNSRREFIRISALGLGGFALAGGTLKALRTVFASDSITGLTPDLTRTPTYCEVCFWKCAGWVYKDEEGKIWKITGNDDDNKKLEPEQWLAESSYYVFVV